MNKKRGLDDLIGEIIDNKYRLKELIRQTSKSWVFKATEQGEISPHRSIALKILKPGQSIERKNQFKREVNRLANLERHPKITTIYSAGKDKGLFYAAIELVPGPDLAQEIEAGKKFSLEEILNIVTDVADVANYIHEKVGGHHDIKLKNIKRREEGKKTKPVYLLDLGGRLRLVKDSKDIFKIGSIFKELLDHRKNPKQKIPKGLENIIKKSTILGNYSSPKDFKNAIESYRKNITRRKFLKVAGSAVALTGLGYVGFKSLEHMNSIDYVVDELKKEEIIDSTDLYESLLKRIYNEKISYWIKKDKIPKGDFLWVTWEDGNVISANSERWIAGKTIRLIGEGAKITGNEIFRDWALNKLKEIKVPEKQGLLEQAKKDINLFRFFDSYGWAYETTKNPYYKETALKAVDALASFRYNKNNFFQSSGILMDGVNIDKDYNKIQADTIIALLPFLWWAYKETGRYYDKITSHINNTIKYNIRDDGSVSEFAKFNKNTKKYDIKNNSYAYNSDSCFARSQAKVFLGLTEAHENAKQPEKQIFLDWTKRVGDFILKNQSRDFVSYYDYYFNNLSEEITDIPKDTYATIIEIKAFNKLYNIINEEKYKKAASQRKQILSTNYLSKDPNILGIISNVCLDPNEKSYQNCFSASSDFSFLQGLK